MLVMLTWEHFHPSQWGLVIAEETLLLVAMLVLTFPAVALWGESVCRLGSLGCETLEEAGMGPEAGADWDTISIKVLTDGYHLWMESSLKEFKHCEVVYQTTSGSPQLPAENVPYSLYLGRSKPLIMLWSWSLVTELPISLALKDKDVRA